VAYGSTNKYRPVSRSKASGNTAKRPTLEVYFPCTTAAMLTMTATVKARYSQRWVCGTHLFQFNGTSSEDEPEADRTHLQVLLQRFGALGGQPGGLNAELLCALGVQSLPAAELHGLGAGDARFV
jgi:hypothetical protein